MHECSAVQGIRHTGVVHWMSVYLHCGHLGCRPRMTLLSLQRSSRLAIKFVASSQYLRDIHPRGFPRFGDRHLGNQHNLKLWSECNSRCNRSYEARIERLLHKPTTTLKILSSQL